MTEQIHPIAQFRKDVKAALPSFGLRNEREQERMSSVLMVAVEKDPALVFADRQSLIAAVRQCANQGLVPDGNEAVLQVYNTKVSVNGKDQWIKKVQYQPMVRGIINRVQRSGMVLAFWAEVVYEGEDFRIDTSEGDRRPVHEIANYFVRGDDSKIIGAYSVAKLKNGTIDCEPMPRSEIEKVRKVAKTDKVWSGWFSEKAKVAVMRRHSKRLPLSAEDLDMILNRGGDEHDLDKDPRDITPESKEPYRTLAQRLQEGDKAPEAPETPEDEKDAPIEGEVTTHWTDVVPYDGAFPGSPEFTAGKKAYADKKPYTDNPYADEEEKAVDWAGGWKQAEKEAEA